MRIHQSATIYIFLAILMNIPIFLGIWMIFEKGWAAFIESGFHQAFYILIPLTGIMLLAVDKSIELNSAKVTIRHMKLFKKETNVEDILFVRLGTRMMRSIPVFFLAIHTKNDVEESDDILGKRAMIVDLNFTKKNREDIYEYFEEKEN